MRSVCLSAISTLAPGIEVDWCGQAPVRQDRLDAHRCGPHGAQDWFDARKSLPGIRHRYLNDATRFGLAAALRCRQQLPCDTAGEQRGVFVGTSVADHAVREIFDQQSLHSGADGLNTVAAPNMSANIVAAHVAIACRGRAFSTTLTGAGLAGFEALYLGLQAINTQRCEQVLCVCTEDTLRAGGVLPGALAAQIDLAPRGARRGMRGLAWGRVAGGADLSARPGAAQRFAQAVAALPSAHARGAQLVCVVEDSPASRATAVSCMQALAEAGLELPTTDIGAVGMGSLEPLLLALPWLTADHPVLLLAVYRCRFLAFSLHP